MRDPKRIPIILEKLKKAWTRHPDLRLGQLIDNLKCMGGDYHDRDIFFVEDDVIERGLDKF